MKKVCKRVYEEECEKCVKGDGRREEKEEGPRGFVFILSGERSDEIQYLRHTGAACPLSSAGQVPKLLRRAAAVLLISRKYSLLWQPIRHLQNAHLQKRALLFLCLVLRICFALAEDI